MNLVFLSTPVLQHALQQGSAAWIEHRFGCDNASDAAAMLACDELRSRTDLLDAMFLGFQQDVGSFKQRIYDDGHRFEGNARPLAEAIMGEDLYPLVLTREWGGKRPLGASVDGSTIDRRSIWEHKQLNAALVAALPYPGAAGVHLNDAAALPKKYRVQMEQQLLVSGAEACLFTASDWTEDDQPIDDRHCWYRADAELRAEIIAGWAQFEADLATHQPRAADPVKVVAEPVRDFPVLNVQLEGRVVASNLVLWRDAVMEQIRGINRELSTDQHFADAKAMVSKLEDGEKRLVLLKEQALGQTATIAEVFNTIDTIKETMRQTRLDLDKLVVAREKAIRGEIAEEGVVKLTAYMQGLDARLADYTGGSPIMPPKAHPKIAADFDKAIKNKRSIKSLRDSVDAELARCKIAASALADQLEANLKTLRANPEHRALFADWRELVFKECDHCALEVSTRIERHRAEQERKIEAQREQIRREEAQRIEREQATARAAEERRQREEQEAADRMKADPSATALRGVDAMREDGFPEVIVRQVEQSVVRVAADGAIQRASGGFGVRRAAVNLGPDDGARQVVPPDEAHTGAVDLKLGEIVATLRLGLTEEFLAELGFHAKRDRQARLYHRGALPAIADALIRHLAGVRNNLHQQQREAA